MWTVLISALQTAVTTPSLQGVLINRSYEPRQRSENRQDSVYIHKVSSRRYGFQGEKFLPDTEELVETWILESVYQISSNVEENPADVNERTAFDIADSMAAFFNSRATRRTLNQAGLNILRITDIRTPYFKNEQDRFEASPSFDFTISYNQTNTIEVPTINEFVSGIQRV